MCGVIGSWGRAGGGGSQLAGGEVGSELIEGTMTTVPLQGQWGNVKMIYTGLQTKDHQQKKDLTTALIHAGHYVATSSLQLLLLLTIT